jgi:hypothetical protein
VETPVTTGESPSMNRIEAVEKVQNY